VALWREILGSNLNRAAEHGPARRNGDDIKRVNVTEAFSTLWEVWGYTVREYKKFVNKSALLGVVTSAISVRRYTANQLPLTYQSPPACPFLENRCAVGHTVEPGIWWHKLTEKNAKSYS